MNRSEESSNGELATIVVSAPNGEIAPIVVNPPNREIAPIVELTSMVRLLPLFKNRAEDFEPILGGENDQMVSRSPSSVVKIKNKKGPKTKPVKKPKSGAAKAKPLNTPASIKKRAATRRAQGGVARQLRAAQKELRAERGPQNRGPRYRLGHHLHGRNLRPQSRRDAVGHAQRLEDQDAKGLSATHNLIGVDLTDPRDHRSPTEAYTVDFLQSHKKVLGFSALDFPERDDPEGANEHSITFHGYPTQWVRDLDIYFERANGEVESYQFQCKGLSNLFLRLRKSLQSRVSDDVGFALYKDVLKDSTDLVLRDATNNLFLEYCYETEITRRSANLLYLRQRMAQT